MSKEKIIEAHGKGMAGCDTVEEWAARHLKVCNGHMGNKRIKFKLLEKNKEAIEKYRSAFDEVKKKQAASQKRKEAMQGEIDKALKDAEKNFA